MSDGLYICSSLLLMISWWVPYLPKGCRPDFNNGLGGDSNSGPDLAPRPLFESNSNNGPSSGHSNLVSDEVYICSSLPLTILSGYRIWPRAPRLTSIMAQEMTFNDVSKQINVRCICMKHFNAPRKQKRSWLTKSKRCLVCLRGALRKGSMGT